MDKFVLKMYMLNKQERWLDWDCYRYWQNTELIGKIISVCPPHPNKMLLRGLGGTWTWFHMIKRYMTLKRNILFCLYFCMNTKSKNRSRHPESTNIWCIGIFGLGQIGPEQFSFMSSMLKIVPFITFRPYLYADLTNISGIKIGNVWQFPFSK